ncbi:hypothetical protein BS78_02G293000 [Paspalum vaginatum]|nr:hypothetical protein BS78_02G293000 [Paspalum vaginatum]
MEYISPERNLEGTCGDPGPFFGDQDGSLLDHLDYQGGGIPQHESPTLDDGLYQAGAIPYLSADSLPFTNDQIQCNVMKSASTSPEPSLKHAQELRDIEPDTQNGAAEQSVHNSNSEEQVTSVGCDVHQNTKVVGVVLPSEHPGSLANDTSNLQPETTYSVAYHGDALLSGNSSKDYQINNSGVDDDEILNSPQLHQMEKSQEISHNEKNGSDDDQMDGRKSSPIDGQDRENFNTSAAPPSWEQIEHENPRTRNGSSTPDNRFDSPPDRFARLERDTPSPDGRVSPERFVRLERDTPSPDRRVSSPVESPHAHHSEKMQSQRQAKDVGDLAQPESSTARRRSRSPEKYDSNRKRASPRELSPHARHDSPVERKKRRESRHADGSPRRRSASPRRRSTPTRRSTSPRRSSHKRRDSPRRGDSPRRRHSPRRRESPRKRDSPRRRDSPKRRRESPRRRGRSKSRSPSRKRDTSRHRREHDRSRSRSPHLRDQHRRSPRRHSPRRRSPPSSHRHHSPRRHWSPPANRKTGLGKPGKNLFIAGFSYATTERDLEKKFGKFGRVTSARVVRDKRTGDSRGFGFLSLAKDEDADAAIRACDETEWNGRIILVEKSKAPA